MQGRHCLLSSRAQQHYHTNLSFQAEKVGAGGLHQTPPLSLQEVSRVLRLANCEPQGRVAAGLRGVHREVRFTRTPRNPQGRSVSVFRRRVGVESGVLEKRGGEQGKMCSFWDTSTLVVKYVSFDQVEKRTYRSRKVYSTLVKTDAPRLTLPRNANPSLQRWSGHLPYRRGAP